MITCLQNTIETSSSLKLWLILTVSFSADDIRTRKSRFQRVPNLMVQQKSPYKNSKTRTHSHTRKKQRPQRGHRTVQRPPETTATQSSPFLDTLKVQVRFLQRPGLHSVPAARPDFNTDSSKLNRDALLKRSEHRIRRRGGRGERSRGADVHRDHHLAQSLFWLKVFSDQQCMYSNVGFWRGVRDDLIISSGSSLCALLPSVRDTLMLTF